MTTIDDTTHPEPAAETAAPAATTALATAPLRTGAQENALTVFGGSESFALAQRMANLLANSTLVPEPYQRFVLNKDSKEWEENPTAIGNCVIALEIASRLRLSPLMVMQNLDVVKGRPGFRGSFVAALVNNSPLFDRLKYEWKGQPGDTKGRACRAYATDASTGEVLYGTWITWEMVTGEGWDKNSKWKTITDQMFMYRSATFWVRVFAPDLLLGMPSYEELDDIAVRDGGASLRELNARLERQLDQGDAKTDETAPTGEGEATPPADKPAPSKRKRAASKNAKPPLDQAPPPTQGAENASAGDAGAMGQPTVTETAAPAQAAAPSLDFNVE